MNKHTLRFILGLLMICLSIRCFDVALNIPHSIWFKAFAFILGLLIFNIGFNHIQKAIKE